MAEMGNYPDETARYQPVIEVEELARLEGERLPASGRGSLKTENAMGHFGVRSTLLVVAIIRNSVPEDELLVLNGGGWPILRPETAASQT